MAQTPAASQQRILRARRGLIPIDLGELYRYRELLGFLAWRDILIRYKQTGLGVAWALAQPLFTMIVFTIVFGKVAKLPSNGVPYSVLTFSALLPWQFFANALSQSSNSVVSQSGMISKVYFPRLIIPASSALGGMMDFLISLVILLCLMIGYSVPFRATLLLLPLFFLLAFLAALGAGLWLSALNVKYRDIKHVIPFLVQAGLYISPVGFSSAIIPEKWRFLYNLNPMVGAIDGFRWAILGPKFEPYWPGFWLCLAMTFVVFVTGAYYFRSTEATFADVI